MAGSSNRGDLDGILDARKRSPIAVRDLTDGTRDQRDAVRSAYPTFTRWLFGAGIKALVVLGIAAAFVIGPPIVDCHKRSSQGFFAGDTLGACAQRGISARMDDIDSQLRKLVHGSGR